MKIDGSFAVMIGTFVGLTIMIVLFKLEEEGAFK